MSTEKLEQSKNEIPARKNLNSSWFKFKFAEYDDSNSYTVFFSRSAQIYDIVVNASKSKQYNVGSIPAGSSLCSTVTVTVTETLSCPLAILCGTEPVSKLTLFLYCCTLNLFFSNKFFLLNLASGDLALTDSEF